MTLEEILKEQIENIDVEQLVKDQVSKAVSNKMYSVLENIIKDELKSIIRVEAEKIMLSGPIKTNDGWGKEEEYPSFEDMFKLLFKKSLDSKYEIQHIFKDIATRKMHELMKEQKDQIIKSILLQIEGK